MFVNACWSDEAVGGVCLTLAFILMFLSLGGVVKCLKAGLEIQLLLVDSIISFFGGEYSFCIHII